MRKILLLSVLFLSQTYFSYALDCVGLGQEYDTLKEQVVVTMDEWKAISTTDPRKATTGKSLSELLSRGVKLENELNDCLNSVKKVNELIETYFDLGNGYFKKKQWDNAIGQYKKVIELDPASYKAYYNIGSAYVNKASLGEALQFYQKARSFARGKIQMQESKNAFDKISTTLKQQEQKREVVSDDSFSHLQYYLRVLEIPDAWKKITEPKEVIVAVIDDGININHPDLTDHIWSEPGAAYGASKIKDFVGDKIPDNLPTGEHGTMIAGIIAATTNNKKGIAGIAKNVKIMPLRVFDFKGNAQEESIINAMYYAINNKANIINLSLGQSQFNYSTKYDEVMKQAYENGVIVVIAAGNGDVLAYSNNGINTTVNPISPVCNNSGSKKYSLGVEALDQKGVRTRWSNYGACASFSAPGENIFSTSVSIFNKESGVDYDTDSGTSFSAPMIAGIIALGYNKYGYVSPDIVYESLNQSLHLNEAGSYIVSAGKYLDMLQGKAERIQKEQKIFQNMPKKIAAPSKIDEKKIIASSAQKKTLKSSQSNISDSDFLIEKGVINKKDFANGFNLSQDVTRQEVVALALKMLNIYLPEKYNCRGLYRDVTSTKPNAGACQVIEVASEKGIVNVAGKYFAPEEKISIAETLNILMKATNIRIEQYSGGEFEPWQTNVFGTAISAGIISGTDKMSPVKKTVRSDLFKIARRILILND